MRSAERELLEIERKRQAVEGGGGGSGSSRAVKATPGDVMKERMSDLTKQITEESKRLANTRAQLQKIKSGSSVGNTVIGTGTGVTVNSISGATSSAGIMKAFLGAGSGAAAAGSNSGGATANGSAPTSTSTTTGKGKKGNNTAAAGGESGGGGGVGATPSVVPESLFPELCR